MNPGSKYGSLHSVNISSKSLVYIQEVLLCIYKRFSCVYTRETLCGYTHEIACAYKRSLVYEGISCIYTKASHVYTQEILVCMFMKRLGACLCPTFRKIMSRIYSSCSDLRLNLAFMATGWVGLLVQGRLRGQGEMPEPQ